MVRKFLKASKLDLLIGLLSAALFAALSLQSFSALESIGKVIYGIQMRLDLPANLADNRIAIVSIDEKSTRQLGPWPWPRSVIADMIQILKNNGARLIGLDILYSDPERNQALQELKELRRSIVAMDTVSAGDPWLMENLAGILERLDNDRILARTVEECGNVILPVLGAVGKYESEVVVQEDSPLKRSSFPVPGDPGSFVQAHQLLLPFEDLAQSCKGFGHVNLSPNRLLQGESHPLYLNYRGHLIPSLGLHLAVAYLGKRADEVLIPGKGVRLGQTFVPAVNGEILLKFKGGKRSFPYYSFVDILNVKKVPAVFDKKIVLIGSTLEGAAFVHTPVEVEMPRIELLANVVENLMNGRFVKRPEPVVYLEILLVVLASFAGALTLPRLSLLNRVAATAGMLFLLLLIGVFSFVALDVWLKTVYAGLSLIALFIAHSVIAMAASARTRDITSKESMETNRMLGLSLQSQGLLDLAFEKFRRCELDEPMKDLVYNLGLDYERKRMMNKAISVYEYILSKDNGFRDLAERTRKLKKLSSPFPAGKEEGSRGGQIVLADDLGVRPTVGRYEIVSKVGQGAMGIVYKAMDPKINRLLAIKTVRFSDEFEEKAIKQVKARFLREAEIAGMLSHPSIVAIYDVGEDYDITYMAMEFLEGETLQKFCRKGSLLPMRRVLSMVGETASALGYAHSRGVVHRDIKPGNIMLLKNGHVKVTDFGIAKAISSSQTRSGVVLGTPGYMSPEQINGDPVDGRSDLFSLGVVLFELLCGQLPFQGKTIANLFYQITQGKHPPLHGVNPKVPRSCEQVVDRLLAKEPERRFQSAGELAKYLAAIGEKMDELRAKPAA